jgi:HEAT repeat protein
MPVNITLADTRLIDECSRLLLANLAGSDRIRSSYFQKYGTFMAHQHQSTIQATDLPEDVLLENLLTSLAKALKAITFYPADHPQREECIAMAFNLAKPLISSQELVLLWSKDACTIADKPDINSRSATAKTLAREMLKRKLQRLIILPRLSQSDLKAFLTITTFDPAAIYAGGGIEAEMSRAGIKTIGANEVDLTLLRGLQQEEESEVLEDATADQSDQEEPEDDTVEEVEPEDLPNIQFSVLGMDILIGMLKAEKNDLKFQELAREVIASAEELKRQEAFETLLPALGDLLAVYAAEARPITQKEFIRYAIEQIAGGSMTTFLLDKIEERSTENASFLDRLCSTVGQTLAYPLIQRLCVAESLHARKTIAIALTSSGEAAIPAIIPMLKDERWYVVRNMVTILGEIGSAETIGALQQTARHPEPKVRKEVIKSFLKINTPAIENSLISLIADENEDVVRQAIFSLGAIRSKTATRPLLDIVMTSDVFLKDLPLKKLALVALGKIGDRQATAALMDLIGIRGWLAPGRWQELKIAVAKTLGHLGDETALPLLKRMARRNTPLGVACSDAADNLERLAK